MSQDDAPSPERRRFLGTASTLAMGGGLAAGYGTFLAYAGRYLYPPKDVETAWQFVTRISDIEEGGSLAYKSPSGARVVVARVGSGSSGADFLALSSTCPHLGCQVHWEAANDRFFCPCHNGVFNAAGEGTDGPPKGQSLLRFPLRVKNGLLYIEVPVGTLAEAPRLQRPGHDGCLSGKGAI